MAKTITLQSVGGSLTFYEWFISDYPQPGSNIRAGGSGVAWNCKVAQTGSLKTIHVENAFSGETLFTLTDSEAAQFTFNGNAITGAQDLYSQIVNI